MFRLLAEVKLEDVFQSTTESMKEGPGSGRLMILIIGAVVMILVLIAMQAWRRRGAMPAPVNHHGKLLKQVAKPLGLKSAEIKQLKQLADEQDLSSPLVLLLCPSLLARAAQDRSPEEKKMLAGLVKRMSKGLSKAEPPPAP